MRRNELPILCLLGCGDVKHETHFYPAYRSNIRSVLFETQLQLLVELES